MKAQKKRLLPEDRDNMQTPGASVRKAILERLDALAVACKDNTTDELWAIAKRFSRPEERTKLATYLEAHGMERERRGKQRCWKRFQSDDRLQEEDLRDYLQGSVQLCSGMEGPAGGDWCSADSGRSSRQARIGARICHIRPAGEAE